MIDDNNIGTRLPAGFSHPLAEDEKMLETEITFQQLQPTRAVRKRRGVGEGAPGMGYVSHQEGIFDRLARKLDLIESRSRGNMLQSQLLHSVADLREVIVDARKVGEQLRSEPDKTKMAAEIVRLREEIDRLEAENNRLRRSAATLERDKLAFQSRSATLSKKVANQKNVLREQAGVSPLPPRNDVDYYAKVDEAVLKYCTDPKPEEKILPKLRRFGDSVLRKRIQWLVRHGKLHEFRGDGKTLYQYSPPDDLS